MGKWRYRVVRTSLTEMTFKLKAEGRWESSYLDIWGTASHAVETTCAQALKQVCAWDV